MPRGRALLSVAEHSQTTSPLGIHSFTLHQCDLHPWCAEQGSGHVQRWSPGHAYNHNYANLGKIWQGGSGLLRQHSAKFGSLWALGTILSWEWMCLRTNCSQTSCFIRLILRLLDWIREDLQKVILIDPRCTNAQWFPVLRSLLSNHPLQLTWREDALFTDRRSDQESSSVGPTPLSLAAEWEHLLNLGLSDNVVHTIQEVHASSMISSYTFKWSLLYFSVGV